VSDWASVPSKIYRDLLQMPNYLDEAHRAEIVKLSTTLTSQTEWPTWLLLVGFYLAWAFIVIYGDALGKVFTLVLLVPLVVLWKSIQNNGSLETMAMSFTATSNYCIGIWSIPWIVPVILPGNKNTKANLGVGK
jgi:hypothetical protein